MLTPFADVISSISQIQSCDIEHLTLPGSTVEPEASREGTAGYQDQ